MHQDKFNSNSKNKSNHVANRTQSTPQKRKPINIAPKKTSDDSTDKFRENLRVGKAQIIVNNIINIIYIKTR